MASLANEIVQVGAHFEDTHFPGNKDFGSGLPTPPEKWTDNEILDYLEDA